MKKLITFLFLILFCFVLRAQDSSKVYTLTMEDYEKVKTFRIKDLDNDTYIKFENKYVLDRYEGRRPYFITGDDGQKKRVDIYRLVLRENKQEIGTVIFYTNEKGTIYQACLPGFKTDGKVWEKYFEDIHAIDKAEPNFVLKLSYVLSREFGFQLYKSANQGKDVSREAGTYGMDICFPGDALVTMSDGKEKPLRDIKKGDRIITVDPTTKKSAAILVTALVEHEEKNYAITHLLLLEIREKQSPGANHINMSVKEISATPNHPFSTQAGEKKAADIKEGDEVLCRDSKTGRYNRYIVWNKTERAGGVQKVYNIETKGAHSFIMNEVMVLQKPSVTPVIHHQSRE